MTVLKLAPENDPSLKQLASKFDFANPPFDPVELSNNLIETMVEYKGLGFAAPQAGVPYRVFVMHTSPTIVCFNPVIVNVSKGKVYMDEGCISFPGLFVKIKRPASVKLRYTDPYGAVETRNFEGMTARIVQHEVDHLGGILFTQLATRYHLELAKNRRRKNGRK